MEPGLNPSGDPVTGAGKANAPLNHINLGLTFIERSAMC